MKRSTRNPTKTRLEIIQKSAPIFNVHGLSGTKMQMLVDATGYQMGGIYKHFGTKQDLAEAAFEYNFNALFQHILEANSNLNPKEQLLEILSAYKKMITIPTVKGGCPILNTAIESDDTNPRLRKMVQRYFNQIHNSIETILQRGKQEGLFHSDIDPKSEALYIIATIEGGIMIGNLLKTGSLLKVLEVLHEYLETKIFRQDKANTL